MSEFSNSKKLLNNYVKRVRSRLSKTTILLVDDSDITKPCSIKMEGLQLIRDGSTGGYGVGYHTLAVTALTPTHKSPIGIYTRVYSATEATFVSATQETLKALEFIRKHFSRNCVRAFDRGYDANIFFEDMIDKKEKFVIRVNNKRKVKYKDNPINIYELSKRFKGKFVLKFKKRNGVKVDCKISIVPIRLSFRPEADLNLVICHGFGKKPLLLITNMKSDDDQIAVTITKVYLLRWRIEEFYRFKKQQFGFEDFRVRSLNSIRNLDLILTIAIGYIGLMSEQVDDKRLVMELIYISKRIFDTPKFMFYAIADGMYDLFARSKKGVSYLLISKPNNYQFSLFRNPIFDIP
jgi:hypothetical protein